MYPDAKWLGSLKVGDVVVVGKSIRKITAETPTRWKVGTVEYRKKDGYRVGASTRLYSWTNDEWLEEPMVEYLAELELSNNRSFVEQFNYKKLDPGTIGKICLILRKWREKK